MKKFAVIVAMVFSLTAMTACGNSNQDKTNDSNIAGEQKQDTETADGTAENDQTAANDQAGAEDQIETQPEDTDTTEENTENEGTQKQETDGKKEEKELLEAGEKPDFELNEDGCFYGKYKGNDGCEYEFTEEGRLTITSDSETLAYQYTLKDDVLSMVAEDGSMGTSRQITLLEDGTYLLDDCMGTQVILTYTDK